MSAFGQDTEPLVVRDVRKPPVLLLPGPADVLVSWSARQRSTPKTKQCEPPAVLSGGDVAHGAASKAVAELVMLIEGCVEQVTLVRQDRADLNTTQQLIRHATGLPAPLLKSPEVWTSGFRRRLPRGARRGGR